MSREELLALPLRELDAMVAEKVMGYKLVSQFPMQSSPAYYSSDDNAVRLVRNRIRELGLVRKFMHVLYSNTSPWWENEFKQMQLPPKEQCVAAILAVQEKERGE